MKKLLYVLLLLMPIGLSAQFVSRIIADSTILDTRVGGYNELTIKNSTRTVSGFLYNIGNGKTGFVSKVVNTMSDLNTIALSPAESPLLQAEYLVKGYYNANDGAGGRFILIDTTGAAAVPGMVIPVGSTKAYVRDVSNAKSYNLKWFGALGNGMESFKQDSTALRNAVRLLDSLPGAKSLYIPGTKKFYGFRGEGLMLTDNFEVYGDGDASEIRNVDPQFSPTIQKGVIFYTGTYDPSNANGIYKAPQFPFYPQARGGNWVKLYNAADTATLYPGKVVIIAARKRYKLPNKLLWRASETVMEEIWRIKGDTIVFKHDLQEDFFAGGISSGSSGIDSTYPRILDVNSGLTSHGALGVDRCTKNVYLHDLYLSQADYNMVDNLPYDQTKIPVNVIGYGATYESKFQNLTLKSFGTFGGNIFNYCDISNLKIVSTKKVFDFGFGSTNNTVHDVNWIYYPSNYEDTTGERSFVYFDDDFHHNVFYNINVNGTNERLDFFKIGRGAHNNKIYNWNFNVPLYNDTSTSPIGVNAVFNWGDDTAYVAHDNIISDITVTLDTIGQWIDYQGIPGNTMKLNNVFQNITFKGNIRNSAGHPAVDLYYAGNTIFRNIVIPDGNTFRVRGCDSGTLMNIYAPKMALNKMDAFYEKVNLNNVFKSSTTGSWQQYTPSAAAPANPIMGMTYFDSTTKKFYGYTNNAWNEMGSTSVVEQDYASGNDTWLDGTAPSGTRTAKYSWVKAGRNVSVWFYIYYTTGGTGNLNVDLVFPSDLPLPFVPAGFNTNNDNMYLSFAKINTTTGNESASSGVAALKKTVSGFKFHVNMGSTNAKTLQFQLNYISAN